MNEIDIKSIRKKFIRITMLSSFIVLMIIVLCINLSTSIIQKISLRSSLDYFVEIQGNYSTQLERKSEDLSNAINPFNVFSHDIHHIDHYYVATFESDELVDTVSDMKGEDQLQPFDSMAEEMKEYPSGYGNFGTYAYKVQKTKKKTIVAILITASETNSRRRLLYLSAIIGICSMVLIYLLVRKLSWRVIEPEIENNRRQKQFITNASHELKTPLSVIRANTELQEMMTGEDQWTKSTLQQVDHLNGLIQNLVMIARSAEVEDKSDLTKINVTSVVDETIDPFMSIIHSEKFTLERMLEKNVTLVADDSKIRQLCTILLDNAIKYCDKEGTITIALHQTRRNGISLVVSNSYAQGSQVQASKFFDRFYREDASHNIDQGGYGIGLSIAESICQQYKGSIEASWKEGIISFTCVLY